MAKSFRRGRLVKCDRWCGGENTPQNNGAIIWTQQLRFAEEELSHAVGPTGGRDRADWWESEEACLVQPSDRLATITYCG